MLLSRNLTLDSRAAPGSLLPLPRAPRVACDCRIRPSVLILARLSAREKQALQHSLGGQGIKH